MVLSAPWLQLHQFIHFLPVVTWKHSSGKKAASKYSVWFINLPLINFCLKSLNCIHCFVLSAVICVLFTHVIMNLPFVLATESTSANECDLYVPCRVRRPVVSRVHAVPVNPMCNTRPP